LERFTWTNCPCPFHRTLNMKVEPGGCHQAFLLFAGYYLCRAWSAADGRLPSALGEWLLAVGSDRTVCSTDAALGARPALSAGFKPFVLNEMSEVVQISSGAVSHRVQPT
jgi:hypothetical protein